MASLPFAGHVGAMTAVAAVRAGVPLVVAGASLDKPEVARRVAWSGVGKNLHTGRPGAGRVRRAVRQLARPEHARRARELGAKMAAAGGAGAAATLLEQLIVDRTRRDDGPDASVAAFTAR